MTDHSTREPVIIINGRLLTEAQATTLRVAVVGMTLNLDTDPDAMGVDEHGRLMHAAYRAHLDAIQAIMATFL